MKSLLVEGLENRMNRYSALVLRLRIGLHEIGMPPYTLDNEMAPVLTAAYGPPGIPASRIVDYLYEKHHIKIAGGLGA